MVIDRATSFRTDVGFDPETLHQKYLEERDKRLRPDGNDQYIHLDGKFADFAEDPYVEPGFERAPLTDSVEVVIVGGGFAGLILAARLRQAGVKDIRIIEKGGDFGGTWYWNRYPGIRCDVESYIYMPLLEETGHIPSEKYARGEEIFAHSQAIAREFDLYSNACLQTQVSKIQWDEESDRWIIKTNRNDVIKARFVCLGGGVMHRAKLPAIPGIEDFEGRGFHTSRWDYSYTGGDATGNLTGLQDKRVAVIGTGATAIQCVPPLAASAQRLYVFQRTPSSVDVRDNKPTESDWAMTLQPGWQKRRMENFTSILTGIPQDEDLVADRWTDVWKRLAVLGTAGPQGSADQDTAAIVQLADYEKMEEIRGRIDSIVMDRTTAESLKPWYNQFCKRPLYSDEFLQTFNLPNVELVDTEGRGVEKITANALHVGGKAYEVDCIIFATGFDVGTPAYESGEYEIVGRDGLSMTAKWKTGIKSLHGVMSRGFPNMFLVGNRGQSGRTVNVPHILTEQATHIATIVARCLSTKVRTIEAVQEAEDAWGETMRLKAVDRSDFEKECTPGYFNNEGKVDPNRPSILGETYGGGPMEYIKLCEEWLQVGFEKDTELTFE